MSLFLWIAHLFPVQPYRAEVEPGALWRGSRLEAKQGASLLAPPAGLRSVVSLNDEDDGGDAPILAKAGLTGALRLLHIRIVDYTAPTQAQIDRFLEWVGDPENQPCLVHCRAGKGRTGVMVACFRIDRGWSLERALAEAADYGMDRRTQIQAVKDFATRAGDGRGRTSPPA